MDEQRRGGYERHGKKKRGLVFIFLAKIEKSEGKKTPQQMGPPSRRSWRRSLAGVCVKKVGSSEFQYREEGTRPPG